MPAPESGKQGSESSSPVAVGTTDRNGRTASTVRTVPPSSVWARRRGVFQPNPAQENLPARHSRFLCANSQGRCQAKLSAWEKHVKLRTEIGRASCREKG